MVKGQPRVRASRPHPLTLYRDSFPSASAHMARAERSEVRVSMEPGDEVVGLTADVRAVDVSTRRWTPVLRLSSGNRVVEVTAVTASQPDVALQVETGTSHVVIVARSLTSEGPRDLTISLELWEACSPLAGIAPYMHSTLTLLVEVAAAPQRPVLLTLSTPATASPRSTQGSFTLAYPSRVHNGRRLTNLYFRRSPASLSYRFGSDEGLTAPWLNIGRAGAAALLIFVIASLATGIDRGDRLGALIATFIAVASVLWDFSREVASFAVYSRARRGIQVPVLLSQVGVIGLLGAAATGLTVAPRLLPVIGRVGLVIAALLLVSSVGALVAHTHGFWHGFQCDYQGCEMRFWWRRSRPECHFTGRVYCTHHQTTVCGRCLHGDDLVHRTLTTQREFGSVSTPCGAVTLDAP